MADPDRSDPGGDGLTLWAYRRRLRGTSGRWRWFALSLRLMAILLCLLAALRLSVTLKEKKKSQSSLLVLMDDSTSMNISDEVGGSRAGRGQ